MRCLLTLGSLLLLPLGARAADHFENDIEPILSRHACNSSGCHGKAEGQGGFKLSVFAFDPQADYTAIVKESRGRRIFVTAPEESLLLQKASGRVPHGGGIRLKVDHPDYQALRNWIAKGMPIGEANAPRVVSLRVEPSSRVLSFNSTQSLKVLAKFSNGQERDVTHHARFQTNRDGLAMVNTEGEVTIGETAGEVAIMAAYLGEVGLFQAIIPRPGNRVPASPAALNPIDSLIDAKLAKLNIQASGLCDDSTFIRRVTLDLNGRLPKPDEVRSFLKNSAPDKRTKLVEALLNRPEFADLMALRWADVLRVDRQILGPERARAYYQWIRESFAHNKPMDQFAWEILTAEGPLNEVPAANFYKAVPKPGEMANSLSQVFLGVRLACAECHHHPSDRWTQTDYAAMTAHFNPLSFRGSAPLDSLIVQGDAMAKHPRTGQLVPAAPLGEGRSAITGDSRQSLAQWMTNPKNPYFARNLANRFWAMLMGRGIIDPVDDVRATNPPSNPELLDALAEHLTKNKYDLRSLMKFICSSRAYQSSTMPTPSNEADELNFSRGQLRRLDAEVLLDKLSQVTGIAERFSGMPARTRAVQLWDSKTKHDFLRLFGRPQRNTSCECERVHEPSTGQVLNLLNSLDLHKKLAHDGGMVAKLVQEFPENGSLVEELYLLIYSRVPTDAERTTAVNYLNKKSKARREAVEDLAWAMLNSLEFLFNH